MNFLNTIFLPHDRGKGRLALVVDGALSSSQLHLNVGVDLSSIVILTHEIYIWPHMCQHFLEIY